MSAHASCIACHNGFRAVKKGYNRKSLRAHIDKGTEVIDAIQLMLDITVVIDKSSHFLCTRCFTLVQSWFLRQKMCLAAHATLSSVISCDSILCSREVSKPYAPPRTKRKVMMTSPTRQAKAKQQKTQKVTYYIIFVISTYTC